MMCRVTGMVLGAVLLYVNVQRVNIFCARHTTVTAAHSGDATTGHDHSALPPDGVHARHDADVPLADGRRHGNDPGTRSPAQLDCCDHLATCAIMLGLREDGTVVHTSPPAGELWAGLQRVTAAWNTAPPAPPPRA